MNKYLLSTLLFVFVSLMANAQQWPEVRQEAKAGARWWWLGSAVDKENLRWTMQEYAKHGIGALEITPIYGVQGNDQRLGHKQAAETNGKTKRRIPRKDQERG